MAGAVHVELAVSAGFEHVIDPTVFGLGQQAGFQHAFDQHTRGGVVRVGKALAGFGGLDGGLLRRQHDVIERALGRRELAVGGEGAGDVAGVAVQLAGGVDQAELPGLEFAIARAVMQDAGVGAGRHDAGVSGKLRTVAAKLVQQFGFKVVFAQASLHAITQQGGRGLHGAHMACGGNRPGSPQNGNFMAVFHQAHFIKQLAQIVLALRAFSTQANAPAHLVQPAIDLALQALVRRERKPHRVLVGQ